MPELAKTAVLFLFLSRGDLDLELVELAKSSAYEPAKVPGHPGELVRAEVHQKEKPVIPVSCIPMPNMISHSP